MSVMLICSTYCVYCADVIVMCLYTASLFRLTYTSVVAYMANEHCMDVLDIRNFGYEPAVT
jgi:hypothetical protein